MLLAGCGTTHKGKPSAEAHVRRSNGPIVRLGTVRVAGGHVSFTGESYRYGSQNYVVLRDYDEARGPRGTILSGGGTSIKTVPRRAVVMEAVGLCLDGHNDILAYGLLNDVADVVVGYERGDAVKFAKVNLPSILHVHGSLVYATLPNGSPVIVTRTHRGGIVVSESYPDEHAACS